LYQRREFDDISVARFLSENFDGCLEPRALDIQTVVEISSKLYVHFKMWLSDEQ
jgi:hypothetical protein